MGIIFYYYIKISHSNDFILDSINFENISFEMTNFKINISLKSTVILQNLKNKYSNYQKPKNFYIF